MKRFARPHVTPEGGSSSEKFFFEPWVQVRIHQGGSFSTSVIETKLILCTKPRSSALDGEITQVVKSWRYLISTKIFLVDLNFNTSYILLEPKIASYILCIWLFSTERGCCGLGRGWNKGSKIIVRILKIMNLKLFQVKISPTWKVFYLTKGVKFILGSCRMHN